MNHSKAAILILVLISVFSVSAQDGEARRALLTEFLNNYKTNHEVAYRSAKEYLKKYPNDDDENAKYMKKWVLALEKVKTEAIAASNGANPPNSRITAEQHNSIGEQHLKLGDFDQATKSFREALKLEPVNVAYRVNLAKALETHKKFAEAETEIREVLRLAPANAEFRSWLAGTLQSQNRLEEAEAEMRKVTALEPSNLQWLKGLVSILKQQNKFKDAEGIINERLAPLRTEVSERRANFERTYKAQERAGEAIDRLIDSLQLLAETYETFGLGSDAKETYLTALQFYSMPHQTPTKSDNLRTALQRVGGALNLSTSASESTLVGNWTCEIQWSHSKDTEQLKLLAGGKGSYQSERVYPSGKREGSSGKITWSISGNEFEDSARRMRGLLSENSLILYSTYNRTSKGLCRKGAAM